MFPGLGNMDPRRIKAMMRQLGIKSEDIDAKRVVFELEGGKRLIVEKPQVSAVDMGGQKTYTVMGEAREESAGAGTEPKFDRPGPGEGMGGTRGAVGMVGEGAGTEIPDSDVDMVSQQAGVSREKARKALEETDGNIAEAIGKLTK